MQNFFIFNIIGVLLMLLGLHFIFNAGDAIGIFLTLTGMASTLIAYGEAFKANKP